MTADQETSTGRSLKRVFLVLETLTNNARPMTLTELSNSLELPKSSMLKLLHRMAALGYLTEDPLSRSYFPSPRVSKLGHLIEIMRLSLHKNQALLVDLRDATEESVSLAVQHGVEAEYHSSLPGFHDLTFNLATGLRYPIYIAAAGRAIVADMDDNEVKKLAKRIEEAQTPEWSQFRLDIFMRELDIIRRQGFATTEPASAENVLSFAKILPVTSGQRVAVTVGGMKARMIANKDRIIAHMNEVIARHYP